MTFIHLFYLYIYIYNDHNFVKIANVILHQLLSFYYRKNSHFRKKLIILQQEPRFFLFSSIYFSGLIEEQVILEVNVIL